MFVIEFDSLKKRRKRKTAGTVEINRKQSSYASKNQFSNLSLFDILIYNSRILVNFVENNNKYLSTICIDR